MIPQIPPSRKIETQEFRRNIKAYNSSTPSPTIGSTIPTITRKKKVGIKKKSPKSIRNGHDNDEDSHSHHSESSIDSGSHSSLVSVKAGLTKCCQKGTQASRRWQMFQMIFLPFIPITALIVQNSTQLSTVVSSLREAGETKDQIVMIAEIGKLLAELQQERADFGFCLFTNTTSSRHRKNGNSSRSRDQGYDEGTDPLAVPPSTYDDDRLEWDRVSACRMTLSPRFVRTDEVIRNLSDYLATYVPTISSISTKREKVFQLTSGSKGATDDTALDELIWYNVANDAILELLNHRIQKTKSTGIWKPLIAYMYIIRAIENYSISMVYGLYYFGKGSLTQNSYNKYVQFDSLASDYLNGTKSFSPEINLLWEQSVALAWKSKGYESAFQSLEESLLRDDRRAVIYRNLATETVANSSAAKIYYSNMTEFINELRLFQTQLREMMEDQIVEEIRSASTKQAVAALLLALVLSISPILLLLVRQILSTIQMYSLDLGTKTTELRRERRKADKLLKQMLPMEVIRQLKKNRQVPAESFECVTVYFSDIVSFTNLSSTSSPMEIIVMLNSLYKLFDSKIELYDVYKVETIGDAYMVVSGLPLKNEDKHAGEICTMALDLLEGVKHYKIPHKPGVSLQIRVGINSGPCVAGVVGTKMPRYCLFGDAINVASRMESHGEAMKIHVTEQTKSILDGLGGYIAESRGILDIKGKGTMTTYWLTGKVGGLPKKEVGLSTPGYYVEATDTVPEFLHDIFGSSQSEDGDDVFKMRCPPPLKGSLVQHPPRVPIGIRNPH